MGTGEARSESDQLARQRRMLSVEFVLAPVQELHARGQVLGFVPGMAEYPPRTGGEQTGKEDEEYESGADQAPNGWRSTMV